MKAGVKVLEVFYVFMIEKHCLNNFCISFSENKHNKIASSNMKKCA